MINSTISVNSEDSTYVGVTTNGNYGRTGWICPVCGAGNSPDASQCPCNTQRFTPYPYYPVYPTYPVYPIYPYHPIWYADPNGTWCLD